MRIHSLIVAAAIAAAPFAGPAAAADETRLAQLSEEELRARFEAQRSKTRGLQLAPVTSSTATAAASTAATQAASQSQSGGGSGGSTAGAAQEGTTVAPAQSGGASTGGAVTTAEVPYIQQDSTDQINVMINFDYNSAALRPSEFEKLGQLCSVISSTPDGQFLIYGHTDASGSDAYNLRLSKLRAQEVRRRMIADCGIPAERLIAVGVGEQHLLRDVAPTAAENRRVEFQIVG